MITDLIHVIDVPRENAEDGEAVAPPSGSMKDAIIAPFQRHKRSTSLYSDSDCLDTDHQWFHAVCGRFMWLRASCVGDFGAGRGGGSAIAILIFLEFRAFQREPI